MGCWNETCNLSNLPILCGQQVRVLLIAGQNNPLFYPFEGEYDDYGSIEDITEDVNTLHIFETITKGDNGFEFKYSDFQKDEYNAAMKGFKGLIRAAERGILLKRDFSKVQVPVSLVFFKDEVYQEVLETIGNLPHWRGETVRSLFEKEREKARENKKKWDALGIGEHSFCEFKLNMCYVWHEHFKFDARAGIEAGLDRMMDLKLLMSFYDGMRRDLDTVWIGRGSQAAEYDFWQKMNEIMTKQCKKDFRKYKKDGGE